MTWQADPPNPPGGQRLIAAFCTVRPFKYAFPQPPLIVPFAVFTKQVCTHSMITQQRARTHPITRLAFSAANGDLDSRSAIAAGATIHSVMARGVGQPFESSKTHGFEELPCDKHGDDAKSRWVCVYCVLIPSPVALFCHQVHFKPSFFPKSSSSK